MTATAPLVRVTALLDRIGVEYAVIGAHGVNAWLEPRFTADIDVTAHIDAETTARLRTALAAEGFEVAAVLGDSLPSGPDFVRFASPDRMVVLEIQAAKTDLQREVIRRAREISTGVPVATPEDLIILKLIADRAKDRQDLLGLIALPDLDWAHIERWAIEWGVTDRLAALRSEAPR